jgi:hypothetical protein
LNEEGLQISGEQLHWREAAARISAAAHLLDDPNAPDTVPDIYGSDSAAEEEEHATEVVVDEVTVTRRHNPTASSMYEEDDEKYYHDE